MTITKMLYLVVLLFGTWMDIRWRALPIYYLAAVGGIGILSALLQNENLLLGICTGMVVGGVFLLTKRIMNGGIGMGDAIFLIISGLYLTPNDLLRMTGYGLLLSVVFGVLHYLIKKVKNSPFPFIPFLLAGYLGILMFI